MATEERASPWLWVGLGCLLSVGLLGGTVVGLGWLGVRQFEKMGEQMQDPELQRERALALLGTETLPEGYYPLVTVSIPFLLDMTMLTDQPPRSDGEPGQPEERGFVFVRSRQLGDDGQELKGYLQGRRDAADTEVLKRISIDLEREEELRRGELEIAGVTFYWASYRGTLHTDQRRNRKGLQTLVLADCPPPDDKLRMAIWFGPDPGAATDERRLELVGTPADEAALAELLAHFDLCR